MLELCKKLCQSREKPFPGCAALGSMSQWLGLVLAAPQCPPVHSWAPRPDRSSCLGPCQATPSFWPCQNPSSELQLGICSVSLGVIRLMRSTNCHGASAGGWAGVRGGSEGLRVLSLPW